MSVLFKVYAGGSYVRSFRSRSAAESYAAELVRRSHPNIGEVEVYREAVDQWTGAAESRCVVCLGSPDGIEFFRG